MSLHWSTGAEAFLLEGALDIYQVEEVKNSLVDYLQSAEKVIIDLAGVTAMDVSGIQLLYSIKKSAKKSGKSFQIFSPSSAVVQYCAALGIPSENLFQEKAETL